MFVYGDGKDVRVEQCELVVPGAAPLVTPSATCVMKTVKVKLDRARGGALTLELEGEISTANKGYKVAFSATTFVRDVVKGTDALIPKDRTKDGGAPP